MISKFSVLFLVIASNKPYDEKHYNSSYRYSKTYILQWVHLSIVLSFPLPTPRSGGRCA